MISELASQEKVIGVKQSRKAIREGRAKRVYLACDADPAITEPVAASCAGGRHPRRDGLHTVPAGPGVPDQRGRVRGGRPLRIKKWVFFGIASPRSVKNKGCRGYTAAKL